MASTNDRTDALRSTFVAGLQSVHGVEHQALALMDRQIERYGNYPEVTDILQTHRVETEEQIRRVEQILADLGETHSGLKDLGLSVAGNMAAIGHTFTGDEILKNTFANYAFENFEAASYMSLIALADAGFPSATSLLQRSLAEEQKTAELVKNSIAPITLKYVQLTAAGERASH